MLGKTRVHVRSVVRLTASAGLVLALVATGCTSEHAPTKAAVAAKASVTEPAKAATTEPASAIQWVSWTPDLFERAKKEHKFVLLDLQAVWCHWCHVMEEVTYRDPKVIELIKSRYIAVKVDQDSRPDISNRYEDYGWPATVVFNDQGGEIVKRQGYLPPVPMAVILQAIIDDPTPGPSVRPAEPIAFSREAALSPDLSRELSARLDKAYDASIGGWGSVHKFVDWDAIEYLISRARSGDADAGKQARQTLTSGLKLIDPVWGGVYQYSVEGDWDHPHFEKLMQFQSEMMRIYALAWANFHDPAYLKAAQDIHRYMVSFLRSPDGAFYVSQDADLHEGEYAEAFFAMDDAGRRRQGVPRIDTHLYARENGWAIRALADTYAWTGDASALAEAQTAAKWVCDHRSLKNSGGFKHGEQDDGGPYLGDSIAMARGFLSLYAATADRDWLRRAESAAVWMRERFGTPETAGFLTAAATDAPAYQPTPQVDENVAAARFFNLLFHYTGQKNYQGMSDRAMRLLATPKVAQGRGFFIGGILVADRERAREPLHVTVLGSKSDATARSLFETATKAPSGYDRIEWWDSAEGPLPNPDVQYPELDFSAAFLCTNGACSSPIRKPEALAAKLNK